MVRRYRQGSSRLSGTLGLNEAFQTVNVGFKGSEEKSCRYHHIVHCYGLNYGYSVGYFAREKSGLIHGHVRLLRTIRFLDNLSFLFISFLHYFVEATLLYQVPIGRYCQLMIVVSYRLKFSNLW